MCLSAKSEYVCMPLCLCACACVFVYHFLNMVKKKSVSKRLTQRRYCHAFCFYLRLANFGFAWVVSVARIYILVVEKTEITTVVGRFFVIFDVKFLSFFLLSNLILNSKSHKKIKKNKFHFEKSGRKFFENGVVKKKLHISTRIE